MVTTNSVLSRLETIQRAVSAEALLDGLELASADFGGVGISLGIIPSIGRPEVFCERNLADWIGFYHDSGLYRSCAFARRTATSISPFTWDEEMEAEADCTFEVASAARTYGLRHGLQVPVITRAGLRGGIFVQTDRATLESEARHALHLYALAAYARLEELETRAPQPGDALSVRELEVLRWFAEGKTAEDVGDILAISPATVMYHYRSVADRYGTLNRTHTVVEALRRGAMRLD